MFSILPCSIWVFRTGLCVKADYRHGLICPVSKLNECSSGEEGNRELYAVHTTHSIECVIRHADRIGDSLYRWVHNPDWGAYVDNRGRRSIQHAGKHGRDVGHQKDSESDADQQGFELRPCRSRAACRLT